MLPQRRQVERVGHPALCCWEPVVSANIDCLRCQAAHRVRKSNYAQLSY